MEAVKAAFKTFDEAGKGVISEEDLKSALKNIDFSEEEVSELVKDSGAKDDAGVNYTKFIEWLEGSDKMKKEKPADKPAEKSNPSSVQDIIKQLQQIKGDAQQDFLKALVADPDLAWFCEGLKPKGESKPAEEKAGAAAPEDAFREPAVRDVYKENCNGINGTPSLVLFMEKSSEAEQAEMKAALVAYAATVYKEDAPPHKQEMLFFYASAAADPDKDTDMRHFAKDLTTNPMLAIFNLDDDEPYFVKRTDASPIDKIAIEQLVASFREKSGAEPIGAPP
jgi:hypothetical protein